MDLNREPTFALVSGVQPEVLLLLAHKFPDKNGCVRRIHPLWHNFFRVNYHRVGEGNVIFESHFVEVHETAVMELN